LDPSSIPPWEGARSVDLAEAEVEETISLIVCITIGASEVAMLSCDRDGDSSSRPSVLDCCPWDESPRDESPQLLFRRIPKVHLSISRHSNPGVNKVAAASAEPDRKVH